MRVCLSRRIGRPGPRGVGAARIEARACCPAIGQRDEDADRRVVASGVLGRRRQGRTDAALALVLLSGPTKYLPLFPGTSP